MPDAATLDAMAWWAGCGALTGLGAWAIVRIVNHRTTYGGASGWDLPPVEVPGFKLPGEGGGKWKSPKAALGLAAWGAAGGALLGWWFAEPGDLNPRLELLAELFGVGTAAFVLVRTMRDTPAVGEAPPDDPDGTAAARLPGAIFQVVVAGLMALFAWFTLR